MYKTILILLISAIGLQAQAQMMGQTQWGSGQWGGTQGCYPQQSQMGQGMGQGPQSAGQQGPGQGGGQQGNEEVKELNSQIAEAKKQIKAKKSEKQRLDRDLERSKEDVNGLISEDYSSFIFEHMENNRQCREYKGYSPGTAEETAAESMTPIQSFSVTQWSQFCDANKTGSVIPSVCDAQVFRHGERGSSSSDCKKGLISYRKGYQQSQKLQSEIDRLTRNMERLNDQLKQAKADAREAQKEARLAGTEGDICIECARSGNGYAAPQSQTNWGNVLANAGAGLAAMYMGYKSNQMVTEQNAALGYPTSYANSSWAAGLPYVYNALNGAMGGCSTAGGAFGYPQNMTAGMSGMMGMNGMMGNSMGMSMNSPVMMQYQMQQYQMQQYQSQLQQQQQYQTMLQYQQMYQQQMLSGTYSSYSPYSNLYASTGLYGSSGFYGYGLNGYYGNGYSTGTSGYAGGITSGYYYTGYSGPGTPVYSSSGLGTTGYNSGIPGSAIYYSGSR